MNRAFWRGSRPDLRRRAAQLVFSLAALEEGRSVTLLDGLVPGDVFDARGRRLAHPLDRDDFFDLRPWIQVVQPVAGALVANPLPVSVELRARGRARVEVIAAGAVVGRGTGGLVGWDTNAPAGTVRIISGRHSVTVPVRFPR